MLNCLIPCLPRARKDIIPSFEKLKPSYFVLYDDGFNYLTKMCLTNMREAAFEMIGFAKTMECTVIISSSDSTDRFEMYLDKGADFILLGEAEQTLLELISKLENKEHDFFGVQGIAFKHDDAVVKTVRRPVMKDLDELPLPAWDMIDIKPYRKNVVEATWIFFQ